MIYKQTSLADWLLDAGTLEPGDTVYLWDGQDGPTPPFADLRAALHAQYGTDTRIRIWKHGARISIFLPADEDHRRSFDARQERVVIKDRDGRQEIECGFVRKLPD